MFSFSYKVHAATISYEDASGDEYIALHVSDEINDTVRIINTPNSRLPNSSRTSWTVLAQECGPLKDNADWQYAPDEDRPHLEFVDPVNLNLTYPY